MNLSIKKDLRYLSALVVLGGLLFGFRLGAYGFLDPDEPFYCLTAKEMVQGHDYWTPSLFGQPQFEKPILFYWVVAGAFKRWGLNEAAARIGPAMAGFLTMIATYFWARALFRRRRVAFLSAAILAANLEFVALSRTVLTDIFLCLFVTLSFLSFTVGYENIRWRRLAWVLVFFFSGLAFLTKGPLGVLIPWAGIASFLVLNREKHILRQWPWGLSILVFAAVTLPWYGFMAAKYGPEFLRHFFIHENVRRFFVAEHRRMDHFFFYPAVILLGFFPWGALVPGALFYGFREGLKNRTFVQKKFLFISLSLWGPFLFFMAAKSKLPSYPFALFPALAILMAAWMDRVWRACGSGARLGKGLIGWAAFYWLFLPCAIVFGVLSYSRKAGLPLQGTIGVIALGLILPLGLAFERFYKRKFTASFALILCAVIFFSGLVVGWLLPKAQPAFSSKPMVEIYRNLSGAPPGFILGGKYLFRGVGFYADTASLGVFGENIKNAFYTPPGLPLVSSMKELSEIRALNYPIYCFFKKKEFEWFEKIDKAGFSYEILWAGYGKYLIRLEHDPTTSFIQNHSAPFGTSVRYEEREVVG